jgi:hypothetical protein
MGWQEAKEQFLGHGQDLPALFRSSDGSLFLAIMRSQGVMDLRGLASMTVAPTV